MKLAYAVLFTALGLAQAASLAQTYEATTCDGAFAAITRIGSICPQSCRSEDDARAKHAHLPACVEGEDERSPSSCGSSVAPDCLPALEFLRSNAEQVVETLEGCDPAAYPGAAIYTSYGPWM